MPGIITHKKIFHESVEYLNKKTKKTSISKYLETLFSHPEFLKAALFGTIGPNIFDYVIKRKKNLFGSEISYEIHNGGSINILQSMLKRILMMSDFNNEWSSTQRAYLYGYISHIVSDSIFHPFVFYWSGFPDIYKKNHIIKYREQNLMFSYNMDTYFLYYYNDEKKFEFKLDDMLPVKKRGYLLKLNGAVKSLILGSLMDTYPSFYKKSIFFKGRGDDNLYTKSFGFLDLIPYLIKLTYKLKRSKNPRIRKYLDSLKRNKLFFTDFAVRYPEPRKVNNHVLNLHRERWFYPAGATGLYYESVEDLLKISKTVIVEIWEDIETAVVNKDNNIESTLKKLSLNALTGEENKSYHDMKEKAPVRLRY